MPMTPKEMVKFLEKNGFYLYSQGKGSHVKYKNDQTGRVTIVPMHNKDLGKGMENAILKQAGLKKK